MVELTGSSELVPSPFVLKAETPSSVNEKVAAVVFGVASFTILMNPASGTKTQSEGSEFGSCEG